MPPPVSIDALTPDFQLLETLSVTEGEIRLLDRHLDRLMASAGHFGFACDREKVRQALLENAGASPGADPFVLRLLLSRDGSVQVQVKPMPPAEAMTRVILCPARVDSADQFLRHKTTARRVYERARQATANEITGSIDDAEILLVNQRGEVTETTIANIAVERLGQNGDAEWVTPPVSSGLLAGTMRAELLQRGEIVEGIIRVEDLKPGTTIRCFNSVRGVYDLPLI